jgi:transcriptional regulator with XRE-family HTH domain
VHDPHRDAHDPPGAARRAHDARNVRACARRRAFRETGGMNGTRRTLGTYLADRRKARGLSQDDLAAELRVTRTVVSAWENDRRRPRADHLEALGRVFGDGEELAAWSTYHDGEQPPLFEAPVPVATLMRRAADGLIDHLSEDPATDGGPGYGWRHDVDDATRPVSALSTAYGLKAVMLGGGSDWRLDLPRARALLRRLELGDGGWSAMTISPLARPEATAVVLSALHKVGEDAGYVAERLELLIETLDRRARGAEAARPYVLISALIELAQLDLDAATSARLVDNLVDLSLVDGAARSWPVVVKTSGLGPSNPSTTHTAAAVCALTAWARRLDDDRLRAVARSGRTWLEHNADLDLEDEEIRSERADGGEESHQVRHFTPAWIVRALAETGCDPHGGVVSRALRATNSYYMPDSSLWRWPRSGGLYPVWMTYHAVAALRSWAGSHEIS